MMYINDCKSLGLYLKKTVNLLTVYHAVGVGRAGAIEMTALFFESALIF